MKLTIDKELKLLEIAVHMIIAPTPPMNLINQKKALKQTLLKDMAAFEEKIVSRKTARIRGVKEYELFPCPFCGNNNLTFYQNWHPIHPRIVGSYTVVCTQCQCETPSAYPFEIDAVTAWNTRNGEKL